MRCPYCKAENPPNAAACGKCGKTAPASEATFVGEDEPQKQSAPSGSPGAPITAGAPATTPEPRTPAGSSLSTTRAPPPARPPVGLAHCTVLVDRVQSRAHL